MDFDLILSNCDLLKLQDLATIISAYGHKYVAHEVIFKDRKKIVFGRLWKLLNRRKSFVWFQVFLITIVFEIC